MENKESLKLIENPNNYNGKVELIKHILENVKIRRKGHYKKFCKFKKINTFMKGFINGLNAVSVCSIVLALSPASPIVMIVGLSTTTISGISSAITSSFAYDASYSSEASSTASYSSSASGHSS